MPGMNMPSLCVIEDNAIFRSMLMELLTSRNFLVSGFFSLDDFLGSLDDAIPDLILSDVLMQGGGGLELIDRLADAGLKIPVVLMSGSDEPGLDRRALEKGACAFLRKPFEMKCLFYALEQARAGLAS